MNEPPKPPEVHHKVSFYLYQIIGVLIIFLIPILALSGVFGATRDKAEASSEVFSIEVEYPTKFRYKTIDPLSIKIRNTSNSAQSLTVTIEEEYLSHFTNVKFSPQEKEITNGKYIFDLGTLQAGESKTISGEIQSEEYGSFKGLIEASSTAEENLQVEVKTISFP